MNHVSGHSTHQQIYVCRFKVSSCKQGDPPAHMLLIHRVVLMFGRSPTTSPSQLWNETSQGKLRPPCNLLTFYSESMTNPRLQITLKLKEKQVGRFQFDPEDYTALHSQTLNTSSRKRLLQTVFEQHTLEFITFVVTELQTCYILCAYKKKLARCNLE